MTPCRRQRSNSSTVDKQAVGLPVNLSSCVCRGGFEQAKHRPGSLVDPIPQVVDVVGGLRLQVGEMRPGDVIHRYAADDLVNIHEERHCLPSLRSSDLLQRP
jgi:hypothetical protein